MAVSNEFFSSSKRKSSRRKNPRGRGEGGGVTRENISKRYSIEVSMRFFSLSMRKPSHSFPLPQGNSPHEDFLFDEEKNSWQLSRTVMTFLFVIEEIFMRKKSLWEGRETMRITSLTMTEIYDSLFYFPPGRKTH